MFVAKEAVDIITAILATAFVVICPLLFLYSQELLIRLRPQLEARVSVASKKMTPRHLDCADEFKKSKSKYYVTFRFSDHTEKEFRVLQKDYHSIQVAQTGILTFQERKKAKDYTKRYLISFDIMGTLSSDSHLDEQYMLDSLEEILKE